MEPPALFVYDTAGLSAHYAAWPENRRVPGVKAPFLGPKDLEQWEEEGGSSPA
jgi:hypothetical protein